MKELLKAFGFLLVFVVGSYLSCLMTAEGAENLISNGGFERSAGHEGYKVEYPTGFSQQYHPRSRITTEPAHVRSGAKAVQLCSDLYFSATRIQTKPGEQFRVSAWVKGTGRMEFLIFEYDSFNEIIRENILGSVPLTGEYAPVSFTYEPTGVVSERIIRPVSTPSQRSLRESAWKKHRPCAMRQFAAARRDFDEENAAKKIGAVRKQRRQRQAWIPGILTAGRQEKNRFFPGGTINHPANFLYA